MDALTRRDLLKKSLNFFVLPSLVQNAFLQSALAEPIRGDIANWLKRIDTIAKDLKGSKLSVKDWREEIALLYSSVSLPDLLDAMDFSRLSQNHGPSGGERFTHIDWSGDPDIISPEWISVDLISLSKDRSIVPHGHNNYVSAFLILDGEFRGRHFDRVTQTETHLYIKPSSDKAFVPGEYSSLGLMEDNVHWFTAKTNHAYMLDVGVKNIENRPTPGPIRVLIDPRGNPNSQGVIEAPIISRNEAIRLFEQAPT